MFQNWSFLWAGATWKLGTGRRGEDFVWAGTIHFTIIELFFSLDFWITKNMYFKLFVRKITISLKIIAWQVEEAVIGGLRPAVIYQVKLLRKPRRCAILKYLTCFIKINFDYYTIT